jgi:glycosyltransferase involved in cell wall biosynthesis
VFDGMKVLFTCGREVAYVRNAMMLEGLKRNHAEIVDAMDDSPSYLGRHLGIIRKLFRLRRSPCDLVFVGFLGQLLIFLVRLLYKKPLVLDAYISIFDKLCNDSKWIRPGSPAGRLLVLLDTWSCRLADLVLLDTDAHIDFFVASFNLPRDKFHRVLVGADESIFFPLPGRSDDGKFRVFYYATYLPLHGTEHIVRAAAQLVGHPEIEFRIVGKGQQYRATRELAQALGATNIDFVEWLPYEELPREIAQADLCLGGHFSSIEKAARVIACKSYQFVAMAKPVVLGDCPANRELFTHGEDAYFVTMADADSLARGILALRQDPELCRRIAAGGYRTYTENGTRAAIGRQLAPVLCKTTAKGQTH